MDLNSCQIGLLIGYNCPRGLIPREVIAPVSEGPFGQKTDLGWGIVGIIDSCSAENDPIGVSHRIITRKVPSVAQDSQNPVMFSLKTKWKESIPLIKSETFSESDMVSPEDPELKAVKSFSCTMESSSTFSLLDRLEHFSSWARAKRAVALCK